MSDTPPPGDELTTGTSTAVDQPQPAPETSLQPATVATRMQDHWLPEFLLRVGLLLGAGLFLYEGVGSPLARNLFAIAGLLLSLLAVTTMVFQWRVLGDWRLPQSQFLYAGLVIVLTFPITAAIAPGFGASLVPGVVETPLVEMAKRLSQIPGLGATAAFIRGVITFCFVVVLLLILMMSSGPGRRGGLVFVGVLLTAICLFFHPSAETVAGFLMLGVFIRFQWEVPLILSPRVREFLKPEQLDYLYELLVRGPLTTGETRILLNNNPNLYAELTELKLVDFDATSREVHPGACLMDDPAASAVGSAFEYARRTAWVLVGVIYVLLPDFIPGPIDDIIVLAICIASGFSLFSLGGARRMGRRRLT